jgi:hypothetical protein
MQNAPAGTFAALLRDYRPRRGSGSLPRLPRRAGTGSEGWNGLLLGSDELVMRASDFWPADSSADNHRSQHNTKPVVGVRFRRLIPVAVRATQVARLIVERPAAEHAPGLQCLRRLSPPSAKKLSDLLKLPGGIFQ